MADKRDRLDVLYGKRKIGRPIILSGERVQLNLWIFKTQQDALKEIRDEEKARREKAGRDDSKQVSVTSCISEAIDAYIAARKRAKS